MAQDELWNRIEPLLAHAAKPSRYIGGELGSQIKESATYRIGLCYPDLYEIGASNIGLAILYEELNKQDWLACERVYAPETDVEALLRERSLPLFTLETKTPLGELDALGFTLQYELTFTNLLNVLDLGGISLLSRDREDEAPLILAGGPCAYNPEPLAPFIDAFFIGEAEDGLVEVLETARAWRDGGRRGGRAAILRTLSGLPGVYVPCQYDEAESAGFMIARPKAGSSAPGTVEKRHLESLRGKGKIRPIVPFAEAVHDRAVVELFRGCTRGCRFCQAGSIYRPIRERPVDEALALAVETIRRTGHRELSFASLCTSDYSRIEELLNKVEERWQGRVSLSLPSLRVDSFGVKLAQLAGGSRKSGLTLAPEAGSQRMRDVINKGVTEHDIMEAVDSAFHAGWQRVKLYFMIGLPQEEEADVHAIADLSLDIVRRGREILGKQAGRLTVVVNVSTFVPKSHTPFQWARQISVPEIEARQAVLRERLRGRHIQLRWHDATISELEGLFARGDRRLAPLLLAAHERGCAFDAWSNRIDRRRWLEAIAESGIDVDAYLDARPLDAELPWDHIATGIDKSYLVSEWARAQDEGLTGDCRWTDCAVCGVCQNFVCDHDLAADG